jgi:hypothetical protein
LTRLMLAHVGWIPPCTAIKEDEPKSDKSESPSKGAGA